MNGIYALSLLTVNADLDLCMPCRELYCLLLLLCRGFPKKASRTARIASDEEIQGTKDAVIQDLERKLRFKEDLLNNGQPVLMEEGCRLGIPAPTSQSLLVLSGSRS